MSFSINTNVASLQAQYYLNQTNNFQNQTINEVTSGLRIVNSGDDAAGLAVANGLRDDQAVLTQGIANANSAQATLQTVDGGISNIGNLLDRLNTLATESASSTFTGGASGRATMQAEFASTEAEITRQATAIGMNSGGSMIGNLSVTIGGGQTVGGGTVTLGLSGAAVDATSLGLIGNSAAGTVALGTDAAVATAVGANDTATFTFTNAAAGGLADYGTTAGVTVTVGLDGVSTQSGLVTAINNALAQAAAANPDFAAANYSASISATGKLVFSTTDAISNTPTVAGADTGAQDLGFIAGGVAATNTGAIDISTQPGAAAAITTITNAVAALGAAQAAVGKSENILNYALNLASTQLTNEASSESQIRDADLAQQAANLTKAQIMEQAGVAALAQANSAPQNILALLKS
ncbi:MAG: flagellin [Bryobacteraceae bacterium]